MITSSDGLLHAGAGDRFISVGVSEVWITDTLAVPRKIGRRFIEWIEPRLMGTPDQYRWYLSRTLYQQFRTVQPYSICSTGMVEQPGHRLTGILADK
jgi:hypothetical protein